MPFLFSYGTLQQEAVQLSTFGRRLDGKAGRRYILYFLVSLKIGHQGLEMSFLRASS